MPNLSDDEHDEDDLPNISSYIVEAPKRTPTSTSLRKPDENLLERFQSYSSSRSTEKWRELENKSRQAARDDDDELVVEENFQEIRIPFYQPAPPVRPASRANSVPHRIEIRPSSPSPPPRPRSPSPPPPPRVAAATPRRSIVVPNQQTSEPYEQKPLDSRKSQSKWEVRLPHLISVSVGPDRQVSRNKRIFLSKSFICEEIG